jgi:hypothetical protein
VNVGFRLEWIMLTGYRACQALFLRAIKNVIFFLDNRFIINNNLPMQPLTLNTKLINQEMDRAGMTRSMLCKRWKISRQVAFYIFREKPVSYAHKFGKLFKRPAKDFVL